MYISKHIGSCRCFHYIDAVSGRCWRVVPASECQGHRQPYPPYPFKANQKMQQVCRHPWKHNMSSKSSLNQQIVSSQGKQDPLEALTLATRWPQIFPCFGVCQDKETPKVLDLEALDSQPTWVVYTLFEKLSVMQIPRRNSTMKTNNLLKQGPSISLRISTSIPFAGLHPSFCPSHGFTFEARLVSALDILTT